MKASKNTLIFLGSLFWSAAGTNILIIGLKNYAKYRSFMNFLISITVFMFFQKFIFGKLVVKHVYRIRSHSEKYQFILNFFDLKGYITMAVMMIGGYALRKYNMVSRHFIAVFYTGLGASLLMSGLLLGSELLKAKLTIADLKRINQRISKIDR